MEKYLIFFEIYVNRMHISLFYSLSTTMVYTLLNESNRRWSSANFSNYEPLTVLDICFDLQ